MIKSILFNFWIALFAFAIYFGSTIYQTGGNVAPIQTIVISFVWAIVGFIVAFGLRAIVNYVLFTPEEIALEEDEEIVAIDTNDGMVASDFVQQATQSTVEFQDESTEDIAQVVRTMLNQNEPLIEK
jgi:hypothetical protein